MNRRDFLSISSLAVFGMTEAHRLLASIPKHKSTKSSYSFLPLPQPKPELWSADSITSTWIGHSTVLLNVFGTTIITDPVLFDDVGITFMGKTIGHRRLTRPALSPHQVPKPDIILLSHAHMDHTDLKSLEYLTELYPNQIQVICAKNTKDIISELAWGNVRELDWWDSISFGDITISAIEVLHNGARYPWEKDRRDGAKVSGRSYNGYVISSQGESVFFGGDTAYTESLGELKNLSINTAFMPIGAYQGYLNNHCTPEEVLRMANLMQCGAIAPIHCMTFNQSDEPFDEPIRRFLHSAEICDVLPVWKLIGEERILFQG